MGYIYTAHTLFLFYNKFPNASQIHCRKELCAINCILYTLDLRSKVPRRGMINKFYTPTVPKKVGDPTLEFDWIF